MLKTISESDMSLAQFERILDQMPALNDIQINGLGEPLMNPLTPQFIRLASERGIKVAMNSNAAFITDEKAAELLDSGLNILKISMDGADAELYQKIRKAKFSPALTGLKRLLEARRKRQENSLSLWFNSVIQRDNREHLLPIVKLADHLGIDQVRFKVVGMFDLFDPHDLGVDKKEIPSLCQKLKDDMQKKNIHVTTNLDDLIRFPERLFRRHEIHPCYSPYNEVYIQCYGGVRLCCEFYDPTSDIGNLFEKDFASIWNGEKMQNIRRRYWQGDTFFSNCRGCNRFYFNEVKYQKMTECHKKFGFLLPRKLPATRLENQ
jgi:radical SAM protein with 4Fe4S-binding SPASM domain